MRCCVPALYMGRVLPDVLLSSQTTSCLCALCAVMLQAQVGDDVASVEAEPKVCCQHSAAEHAPWRCQQLPCPGACNRGCQQWQQPELRMTFDMNELQAELPSDGGLNFTSAKGACMRQQLHVVRVDL
jgi:hypothetical protein